jgi:mannose-6-phosphate isomerase-like protein (cupin superfamily)
MSNAYKTNIELKTLTNNNYRKVLFTTAQMQLVVMSLKQGQDIPKERHHKITQFIRVEEGILLAIIGRTKYRLKDGDSIIIPAGSWHYIKNIGDSSVKLYTIYSPPEHPDGLVQKNQ